MTMQRNSSLPLVSVITPSFNQGRFIGQTIESVLGQAYPNIEYWVIDGGSGDNTPAILKSYGERLHYISEPDSGQANAINKGLARSRGEILCFLNSDDIFLPGAIQSVVEAFVSSKALWVTGDYSIIDINGRPIHGFVGSYKRFLRYFSSRTLLSIANYIVQPSTFWRRELWAQLGPLDESLRYTMDYDYWLRAFEKEPPFILRKELSAFRIHGASKGGSEYDRQFDEELKVLKKHHIQGFAAGCHRAHNALIKAAYRITK